MSEDVAHDDGLQAGEMGQRKESRDYLAQDYRSCVIGVYSVDTYVVTCERTTMREVSIRDLKQQASEVLRKIREERETVTVTYRGRAIARIVPMEDTEKRWDETWAAWREMDELAAEIGRQLPPGTLAAEAVEDQRREP